MRTVDDFARIRQADREGLSSRQIATQLGVGRDTVRKALQNAEPTPYKLSEPRPAPVFGPFRPFVDAMLAQDRPRRASSGTRPARSTVAWLPSTAIEASTIKFVGIFSSVDSAAGRRSFRWTTGRAFARKPTSAISTWTSLRVGVRCQS